MLCNNCGNLIPEGYNACPYCGMAMAAPAPAPAAAEPMTEDLSKEQEFLDGIYSMLAKERIAWKVCGLVGVIGGGILAIFGFILWVLLPYAISAIAFGIIGLKMIGKLNFYMERVYTEPDVVFARTGSIGMIVFCAIFNEIALIFYIINFVKTKSNAQLIEVIKSRFMYQY